MVSQFLINEAEFSVIIFRFKREFLQHHSFPAAVEKLAL